MDQSATAVLAFAPPVALPVAVDFHGGRLTSDGGWSWVTEADAALGLCAALAAAVPDRRRHGRHAVVDLFRQRIYQIAAGYADQNDADASAMSARVQGRFTELADRRKPGLSMPWFFKVKVASKLRCYRFCNISHDAWYFDEVGRAVTQTVETERIDIVVVEYPFYTKALDGLTGVLKVVDMHDVFADRYKEFLRNGKKPFPWYSVSPLGEKRAIRRADIVLAIQDGDAAVFRSYGHPGVLTLSFSPKPSRQSKLASSPRLRICFLGTKNFFNIRALEYYLQRIHPSLLSAGIAYEFVVIGGVCESFSTVMLKGDVKLLGKVDDLDAELAKCDVLVNPLNSGTGLPIKVLDALASGLHVLATDAGARGLPRRHELSAVRICTAEQDWVDAVRQLAEKKRNGADFASVALRDLALIQESVDASIRTLHDMLLSGVHSLGGTAPGGNGVYKA